MDSRIPLVFGTAARPGEVVLTEGEGFDRPGHGAVCACCTPRGAAALSLARLYLAAVRDNAWPSQVRVVASAAGRAAVMEALARDPVVRARFRRG